MAIKLETLEKLKSERMKWQEKADFALQKVAEIQKQEHETMNELLVQTAREVYATDADIVEFITKLKGEQHA